MNEENTIEAKPETSVESPVLVLPGHIFFVDRIDLPAALESSEIDDFAELSLEGVAPFPIEQLYWGFLYSESDASILLYAAYKERVKSLVHKDLESYTWVLPDFALTSGAYFPEATTLLLESEGGSSQISLGTGGGLPDEVLSCAPNRELPPPAKESKSFRIHLESATVNDQGLPTFNFVSAERIEQDTAGNWQKLSPNQNELWRSDIRDADFKKGERNTRKLSSWVARATLYAALFAILLIILEGALYLGTFWLESQSAKIAEQAPEVRRVEDKQSLMNKLDQVAQNGLRPVAILNALNKTRPKGIYFTSTVTEGQNRIIIDGIANTINELNAYMEALRASGSFELLGAPKTLTRGGKTTFTATLDYIHTENVAADGEEEKG